MNFGFSNRPLVDYIRAFKSIIYISINRFLFGSIGKMVFIFSPLKIDGKKNIYIEDNVHIYYKTWLFALPITSGDKCKLKIGKGSTIGNFNHIVATHSIVIGDNVLTADKVYISDNIHNYDDIKVPIKDQKIFQKKDVQIGDGSWLGENVCVIGASIGKHCIIGANSVVTKDIPDYSVAVGVPAKIIKRYNFELQKWVNIS